MPRFKHEYRALNSQVEKHIICQLITHQFNKSGINTRCLLADLLIDPRWETFAKKYSEFRLVKFKCDVQMVVEKRSLLQEVVQEGAIQTTGNLLDVHDPEADPPVAAKGIQVRRLETDTVQFGNPDRTKKNGLNFAVHMPKKRAHGTCYQEDNTVLLNNGWKCLLKGMPDGTDAFRMVPDPGYDKVVLESTGGQYQTYDRSLQHYYNWFIGSIDRNSELRESFHTDQTELTEDPRHLVCTGGNVQYGQMNNSVSQKLKFQAADTTSKWVSTDVKIGAPPITFCPTLLVAFNTMTKTIYWDDWEVDQGGIANFLTTFYIETRSPRLFE